MKNYIKSEKIKRDIDEDQDDEHLYPTPENLKTIKNWKCIIWEDYRSLAKYICHCWHWEKPWVHLHKNILKLSTGGWSGNEEIINCIQKNKMFMMVCFYSQRRGGHYVFKLPTKSFFE